MKLKKSLIKPYENPISYKISRISKLILKIKVLNTLFCIILDMDLKEDKKMDNGFAKKRKESAKESA